MMDYVPGPAAGARIGKKDGDQWTLVLVRDLRHGPEKVWRALTDPEQVREWAPFDIEGDLCTPGGTVKLTWVGTATPLDTVVRRADAPRVLEYGDIRWELEELGTGTRLTLWAAINRRFISMGAAGWHIAFDVLDRLLGGVPIGRLSGSQTMRMQGWQRLNAEYAAQFGVEMPSWSQCGTAGEEGKAAG